MLTDISQFLSEEENFLKRRSHWTNEFKCVGLK